MDFPAAGEALWGISDRTGIRPEWLLPTLNFESGLNPSADNGVGYYGLNQISGSQLGAMGIDPQDYKTWASSEQLSRVVGPYFEALVNRFGPLRSATRVEQANYLPATLASARRLGDVVSSYPSAFYTDNRVFDHGGKGYITVGDLGETMAKSAASAGVQNALRQTYSLRPGESPSDPVYGDDFLSPGASIALAGAILFLSAAVAHTIHPEMFPRWLRI